MNKFVDDTLADYITKFIRNTILPNLNTEHFEFIIKLLIELIEYISIRFNFDLSTNVSRSEYEYQLKQNNNKDLIAIFNLLLPYIDDTGGTYDLHHKITDLKDITILKNEDIKGTTQEGYFPTDEIHKNPYKITNLQYSHADLLESHYNSNFTESPYVIEHEYGIHDLVSNFHLLLSTIDQISHKLYVNWLNVRPIHPKKYKETRLYKESYKSIIEQNTNKTKLVLPNGKPMETTIHKQFDRYSGVSLGDYYNVIHHNLYFGVKDFKWFIYEKSLGNSEYEIYINVFFDNFTNMLDFIKADTAFGEIDDKTKEQWEFAKSKLSNDMKDTNFSICYNILYYLQRKYTNRHELEEYNYKELKLPNQEINKHDEDMAFLEEFDEKSRLDIPNVLDVQVSWDSLNLKHLYDYMRETVLKFVKTWYGHQIITLKNKYPKLDDNEIFATPSYKLTYKDIYNFSKSVLITIFSNSIKNKKKSQGLVNKLMRFKHYKWADLTAHELDIDEDLSEFPLYGQQSKFVDILLDYGTVDGWFNIKHILENKKQPVTLQDDIRKSVIKNLTDIVFECLIYDGLLTEYVVDKYCTDKHNFTDNNRRDNINTRIFNDENLRTYNDCIYYVTGDTYGNLPLIINKDKTETYFEWLKHEWWYAFYAMDWVSQISFYHRYINNRVILVTGATGAGKSTQVPKLLLYSLKMINFNVQGKVVSTQPRVGPTRGNAERISDEMGVSIKSYSQLYGEQISNFMGYIQYKTANDSHISESDKYFLKEMTDGSLVEELYNNPLLKMHNLEKDDKKRDEFNYGITNKYDIVVIDESHEHNKNMDIILTLMKYALKWNNSLKLVIVSATMEEDEPIYRRYYKSINDDNMYPFNLYNRSNPEHTKHPNDPLIEFEYNVNENENETENVDTVNEKADWKRPIQRSLLDRRIHISPPGESTQHAIVDTYLAKDTENYEEAEQQGIKQVYEILNSNKPGDILFFTHGIKPIDNLVTLFNKNNNTPGNVIALPYHSKVSSEWQKHATETYNTLTVNKEDILAEINLKGSGINTPVPEGTYNRVIVIATNAAEASITIPNLKHVIDTGYYNSVIFDTTNNKTIQSIEMITEASRKQRRGRVGRRSSGWVWYMYAKGTREDIVAKYSICTQDIRGDLMKMMRTNNTEELLIPRIFSNNDIYHFDKKFVNKDIYIYNEESSILDWLTLTSYNSFYESDIFETYKPSAQYKHIWDNIKIILQYQHTIQAIDDDKYYFYDVSTRGTNTKTTEIIDIHERYETGYTLTTLLDFAGSFHIIHPGEISIKRNTLTGVIPLMMYDKYNLINDAKNFIEKALSPLESLYYSRMLVADTKLNIGQIIQPKLIMKQLGYFSDPVFLCKYKLFFNNFTKDNEMEIFFKTDFGKQADKITRLIEIDKLPGLEQVDTTIKTGCIHAIIYGILFEIHTNICGIIAVMFAFGDNIKDIMMTYTKNGKQMTDFKNNPLDKFRSLNGDLLVFNNIFTSFNETYPHILTIENTAFEKQTTNYEVDRSSYLELKTKILSQIKKKQNPWNSLPGDKDMFKELQKIDQNGNLNANSGIKQYDEFKKKRIKTSVTNADIESIVTWATIRKLSYEKVKNMIRIYKYLLLKIQRLIDDNSLEWFKNNVPIFRSGSGEDNIVKCFLYGFSRNILIYNNGSYIDFYKSEQLNITKSQQLNKMPNHNYLLFITTNSKTKEPSNINKIDIQWLIEYIPDIITSGVIKPTTNHHNVYVDIANTSHKSILERYISTSDTTQQSDNTKAKALTHNNNLRNFFHSKLYNTS